MNRVPITKINFGVQNLLFPTFRGISRPGWAGFGTVEGVPALAQDGMR